ncbi:MAG: serine O-acetyltransferase, partial [Psychrobacillus psychrotolerans]
GKRHPTLHNNVLVATGAKVLGSIIIGENSKVGAGSVVLKDVPTNSTVVGIPGVVVIQDGIKVKRNLDHQDLPDPFTDHCKQMENKIEKLQKEIDELTKEKRENSHDNPNF